MTTGRNTLIAGTLNAPTRPVAPYYMARQTFGEWVTMHRERIGLGVRALGVKAGASHATISKIEDGYGLSRDMVVKIADALGQSPTEALRIWLADDNQEGDPIEYVTDREEYVFLENYRGLNSSATKTLARKILEEMRRMEKETAIGGKRADEGDNVHTEVQPNGELAS